MERRSQRPNTTTRTNGTQGNNPAPTLRLGRTAPNTATRQAGTRGTAGAVRGSLARTTARGATRQAGTRGAAGAVRGSLARTTARGGQCSSAAGSSAQLPTAAPEVTRRSPRLARMLATANNDVVAPTATTSTACSPIQAYTAVRETVDAATSPFSFQNTRRLSSGAVFNCVVCFDVTQATEFCSLRCTHTFCRQCINQCTHCPLCRRLITEESKHFFHAS